MAGIFEQLNSKDNKKPAKSVGLFAKLNKVESSNKYANFKESQLEQRAPTITAKASPLSKNMQGILRGKSFNLPSKTELKPQNKIPYAETFKEVPRNIKSGNILGGLGNSLKGTGQMLLQGLAAPQKLVLNASKGIIDTVKGKKASFNPDITTDSYLKDTGNAQGDKFYNTKVGQFAKGVFNLGSDPLTVVGGGIADDVLRATTKGAKGLENLGSIGKKASEKLADNPLLRSLNDKLTTVPKGINANLAAREALTAANKFETKSKPLNDLPTIKYQSEVITPTISKEVPTMANIKPQQQIKYTTLRAPKKDIPIENVVNKVSALRDKKLTGYHGTKNAGFESFNTDKPTWFTKNPEMADAYTGRTDGQVDTSRIANSKDSPGMYKSALDIKNPFKLDRDITEFPTYKEASETLGIRPGTLMGFKKEYLNKVIPQSEIKNIKLKLDEIGVTAKYGLYFDKKTREQFFDATGDIFDDNYNPGRIPTLEQNKLIKEYDYAINSKDKRIQKVKNYRDTIDNSHMSKPLYATVNTPEYKKMLQSKGYDGIIATDQGERTFAAFESKQIENAIGGTNKTTPSTTLQKGLIPQQGSRQIGEAQRKLITSKLKPKSAAINIDTPKLSIPVEKPVVGNGLKDKLPKSQFAQTVADSKNTTPQVTEGLKELDLGYDVATNAKSLEQANARIATDTESAVRFVLDTKVGSAEHTTTAIQLINKFQKEGNYERAVDIASDISSKLTKSGQAIQAASIYDRLSPEGILLYAQRKVNKLNDERWFKGLTKEQKIDPNLAKQLQELSQNMKGLTGDAKIEASQELQQALQALGKSTLGRKIESAQTIAQLLNPKTMIRNTIGNELFYRLERLNKYVATPIDIARSVLTGTKRTVTFRKAGQGGYWNGFFKGTKAGWKGVNPGGLQTQFDLTSPAFKGKWNPLTYMEKTLGAVLKGFDYAAYTRAVNQTIGEMAELKSINLGLKRNKLTVADFVKNTEKNILDIADQYGKYVTFQDDNILSKGLSAVKRGLNVGKDFGAGSLIIKYPKTPGALIMRGLDYSPAGFLKSAYEVAKPLFKGGKIDQREATMALSRAITGTLGFTGLGYYLADNGVITGRTDKDRDVRDMQKQTGAGSYKVNLSALQRWALGGFHTADLQLKDNDLLYSYDWIQPVALSISLGANINTNLKESKGAFDNLGATVASSLEGALGTIAEQPVLQGLTRQFQGYDLGQNVTQTLKGIPSSFTPTAFNQIRQLKDNTGRSTYNPKPLKESLNMAQVKVPGKSEQLPVNYDTLGKQKENYQNGSNNILNVLFNPGFITRNKPTPVQKEILRLYEKTGDKTHFPRVISSKLTYSIKGESNSYTFTQEEKPLYQKAVGELVQSGITNLMLDPNYKLATDSEKVKKVYNVLNSASETAKNDFLKRKGLK